MKIPRMAKALDYLDERFIDENLKYKPKTKKKVLKPLLIAASVCIVVLGLFKMNSEKLLSGKGYELVLEAYSLNEDDTICKVAMQMGKSVPVTPFATTSGARGFVFSYNKQDPNEISSGLIISMGADLTDEQIEDIIRMDDEQGKVYTYYIVPDEATYPLPLFYSTTDEKNNKIIMFDIIVDKHGDNYTAKLGNMEVHERVFE